MRDRDYPASARSVRDGFAVRAGDTPGQLHVIGVVQLRLDRDDSSSLNTLLRRAENEALES